MSINLFVFLEWNFALVLRSDRKNAFWTEAYNILPCFVKLEKLSEDNVSKIVRPRIAEFIPEPAYFVEVVTTKTSSKFEVYMQNCGMENCLHEQKIKYCPLCDFICR